MHAAYRYDVMMIMVMIIAKEEVVVAMGMLTSVIKRRRS